MHPDAAETLACPRSDTVIIDTLDVYVTTDLHTQVETGMLSARAQQQAPLLLFCRFSLPHLSNRA